MITAQEAERLAEPPINLRIRTTDVGHPLIEWMLCEPKDFYIKNKVAIRIANVTPRRWVLIDAVAMLLAFTAFLVIGGINYPKNYDENFAKYVLVITAITLSGFIVLSLFHWNIGKWHNRWLARISKPQKANVMLANPKEAEFALSLLWTAPIEARQNPSVEHFQSIQLERVADFVVYTPAAPFTIPSDRPREHHLALATTDKQLLLVARHFGMARDLEGVSAILRRSFLEAPVPGSGSRGMRQPTTDPGCDAGDAI